MMAPCNIFYSSKSMMEMLEIDTYKINNEQTFNVDKTFLKFSIKDLSCFSDTISVLTNDLKRFNDEHGVASQQALRESEIVDEINKDLDFNRHGKTQVGNLELSGENTPILKEEPRIEVRPLDRNISEIQKGMSHGLQRSLMHNKRKQTDDITAMEKSLIDRTGSIANPDEETYQSRLLNHENDFKSDLIRKDECQNGYSSIDICCTGLRVVLMNEQDNIYYPVMDFNVSEVHLEQMSTLK